MKANNRKSRHPALPRAGSWYVVLGVSVVFTACGAKSQQDGNPQQPSSGGAAAWGGAGTLSGGAESGGASVSGGAESGGANESGGAESGGTRGHGSGGATAQAGGALGDAGGDDGGKANCDLTPLWDAVRTASIHGLGDCIMSDNPKASQAQAWGAIIIDDEGRVVVATGPAQSIVDKLTNERWQCYAGTTFLYWCSVPG